MNKSLDYYMSLPYRMLVTLGNEGIYTLCFPDLPGCITVGKSPAEVIENAKDAKENWFMACIEDGITIPEPSTDYVYSA